MQRIAIARALIHRPRLLLADEPTGNLDSRNGQRILELLRHLSDETGTALVLVTHSPEAAAICHREIRLRDGVIRQGLPACPSPFPRDLQPALLHGFGATAPQRTSAAEDGRASG